MKISLATLLLGFLAFSYVNQTYLDGFRVDLTENQLYTLTDGTREVIAQIDEPIHFQFFFSSNASRELTSLRGYAQQVEALLREYERIADGKITLSVIDPEPFSESEDLAAEFGLQSVPVGTAAESLYFGLAATNAQEQLVTIGFFQPDKEAFLEYDVSRAIQSLLQTEVPVIGVMSSLKMEGDINMQTFQTTPPWMIVDQLEQQYDIESLPMTSEQIPEHLKLLVLVHPKSLADETLYAIDQFLMRGGRLLLFIDPFAEMDRPASANPMLEPPATASPSDFATLMSRWGLELESDVVIGDADLGLSVGSPSGMPVRHLAILGVTQEQVNQGDIAIADVKSLNLSSAGILTIDEPPANLDIQPLISVGPFAALIPVVRLQAMTEPEDLMRDFTPSGEVYHLAVRLQGETMSAFNDSALKTEGHIDSTKDLNVVIVADTDLLSDRLWVQVQNFFGQRIADPFAGNGDFVANMVDNLSGNAALISIRSRGQYSRPFHVVEDLRREAEAKYLESAEQLQARLLETETRLAELAGNPTNEGFAEVTPEQEAELLRFQQQKLDIRKQLREVRHQLDKDIEQLGTTLKFLNILLLPLLMILALMMFQYLALSRRSIAEPAKG